jgi:endonuclease YncB( thermonuclease family)
MNKHIGRGSGPRHRGRRNLRAHRLCAPPPTSRPPRSLDAGAARRSAARRLLPFLGCVALGLAAVNERALSAGPPAETSSGAPTAAAASPAGTAPAIEEWLNQAVRLRDTAEARDRPSADGKPAGEIRAGAEVKAIGVVAGNGWVQIELPDHAIAYLPRSAIAFENGATAAAPPEPPAAKAATAQPTAIPAAANPAGEIRGSVARVPNAATLVVADQRIRLSGIDPGPQVALGPFEKWVEAQGQLVCDPDAGTGRYRCLTGSGVDVAQAAILNGAGRVGDGASPAYRDSETQARNAKRGLWGQP